MSRVAYLDCFSGVSGDMLLGALLDASAGGGSARTGGRLAAFGGGLSPRALRAELARLPLEGYRLAVRRVKRGDIAATQVSVVIDEAVAQPRRRLSEALAVIEGSGLPPSDRERAAAVLRRLAEAEARVHACKPEEVEFHELGAIDTLVDVVGAVAGLRLLGVEELYCSPLPAGGGAAKGAHGTLPVPAPATLELLARAGAPLRAAPDAPFELVTPTGAAIVATLARFERPAMRLEAVGYGAGARDTPAQPNVLRLWLGQSMAAARPSMLLVETNIDDMNPELFAYVQELLFEAGAADVWFAPIQMKKNRPATLLSVLCAHEREDAVVRLLLRETSTLGARVSEVARHEARRESLEFESSLGPAAVKVKWLEGEPPRVAPEYEACRRLARARKLPLAEVYRTVAAEAERLLARRRSKARTSR